MVFFFKKNLHLSTHPSYWNGRNGSDLVTEILGTKLCQEQIVVEPTLLYMHG